jgi:hypothetical protein
MQTVEQEVISRAAVPKLLAINAKPSEPTSWLPIPQAQESLF